MRLQTIYPLVISLCTVVLPITAAPMVTEYLRGAGEMFEVSAADQLSHASAIKDVFLNGENALQDSKNWVTTLKAEPRFQAFKSAELAASTPGNRARVVKSLNGDPSISKGMREEETNKALSDPFHPFHNEVKAITAVKTEAAGGAAASAGDTQLVQQMKDDTTHPLYRAAKNTVRPTPPASPAKVNLADQSSVKKAEKPIPPPRTPNTGKASAGQSSANLGSTEQPSGKVEEALASGGKSTLDESAGTKPAVGQGKASVPPPSTPNLGKANRPVPPPRLGKSY